MSLGAGALSAGRQRATKTQSSPELTCSACSSAYRYRPERLSNRCAACLALASLPHSHSRLPSQTPRRSPPSHDPSPTPPGFSIKSGVASHHTQRRYIGPLRCVHTEGHWSWVQRRGFVRVRLGDGGEGMSASVCTKLVNIGSYLDILVVYAQEMNRRDSASARSRRSRRYCRRPAPSLCLKLQRSPGHHPTRRRIRKTLRAHLAQVAGSARGGRRGSAGAERAGSL